MIDLTELQQEVHALAREKGWYDDRDLSDPDVRAAMLCLIHSEVSEALECVRSGRMTVSYEYQGLDDVFVGLDPEHPVFGLGKPVGFPSELADVVIRALDYAAAFNLLIDLDDNRIFVRAKTPTNIAARLQGIHATLQESDVTFVPADCFDLAESIGFDLLEVIKIKHEYNKTRPRRHGGKAL